MLAETAHTDSSAMAERLKAARQRAGLTQEAAAAHLQVARTTLVAMERGQRRVRPEELRALADLYGLSVNALLRPSTVLVDLAPKFRALPQNHDDPARIAVDLLTALAAAEVELERLLDQPLRPAYPPERPLYPGDLREQAEDAAMDLRSRLGLGLAPMGDIVSLLELELGVRVFIRRLESRIAGLFAYQEEVGACMLLNRNHPRERRALTAAHELGHLLMARRETEIVEADHRAESREERFAKFFSYSFMMPAAGIRQRFRAFAQEAGRFSPRHLILMAFSFSVSMEAMGRRLEELELLPRGTWDSLKERGFSGAMVKEVLGDRATADDSPVPPRLWLLAAEAHRRELLSEGQLARMLKMDRLEIREILDLEERHAAWSVAPE
ncbi:MAG: helix-turn-helix domain-containing protein [Alphaproteobacteria bacterium]|nr:helix-turn-helix domain-containing protein [Alphaproteobacteria bacterium]